MVCFNFIALAGRHQKEDLHLHHSPHHAGRWRLWRWLGSGAIMPQANEALSARRYSCPRPTRRIPKGGGGQGNQGGQGGQQPHRAWRPACSSPPRTASTRSASPPIACVGAARGIGPGSDRRRLWRVALLVEGELSPARWPFPVRSPGPASPCPWRRCTRRWGSHSLGPSRRSLFLCSSSSCFALFSLAFCRYTRVTVGRPPLLEPERVLRGARQPVRPAHVNGSLTSNASPKRPRR